MCGVVLGEPLDTQRRYGFELTCICFRIPMEDPFADPVAPVILVDSHHSMMPECVSLFFAFPVRLSDARPSQGLNMCRKTASFSEQRSTLPRL